MWNSIRMKFTRRHTLRCRVHNIQICRCWLCETSAKVNSRHLRWSLMWFSIYSKQGLLKWKEATREKKFWAQHIQFRIHIHTQMFCAMSHKAWRWWWWRRRRVVGAGRSFLSSSFTSWARGGWNNFLNIFMYSTFVVCRNFPCMLLSICLGESEKRRKFIWNWRRRFQFDHVEKSLCVRCRMNECELRCLEKLLNTTEIEAWQKKKESSKNSHTRLRREKYKTEGKLICHMMPFLQKIC